MKQKGEKKKQKTEANTKGSINAKLVMIEIDPRSTIKISYIEKTASQPLVLIQVALMWLASVKFNREHFILSQGNEWKGTNIWLSINMADWEKMGKDLPELN